MYRYLTILGFLLASTRPAFALGWKWSITDNNGNISFGSLTTDGTSYQTNVVYNITSISGISNLGALGKTIAQISNYSDATNTLQWDGTKISPFILNYDGTAWENTDGNSVGILYLAGSSNGNYGAVDRYIQTYDNKDYSIVSSTLTPVPFEFSLEQGFILGIPLFLGLRYFKKKKV